MVARLAAVGLLLLSACDAQVAKVTPSAPGTVGGAENWASHNAGADESAYSRLAAINTKTVGRLGLTWWHDLPGEASLEATPLAIDGVLYFTGAYGAVYAMDGVTGRLLWSHDPKTWKHNPAKMRFGFAANRGVAYAGGRVFSAAYDGRLFALDAKKGKLLWSVETTPRDGGQTITGAPRVFNGKVIIGHGGADFGARGYVTAYDQATGKQAWRFYTAPGSPEENRGDPAMELAAATWSGEYWKTGTGGAAWDNFTFDPELNRIYVGTANAAPYDAEARSPGAGDSLYTASIVALDADTGRYVWHYQVNPRDSWDFDCTQQMTLADLTIDGQPRKVLMQAPKNGFFYVLDRHTGRLISAEKIGKATWAERIDLETGRPVEASNLRDAAGDAVTWPSPTGAHGWQSMSFSPRTGLVYIPYMQNGERVATARPRQGDVSMAALSTGSTPADPMDGKGALLAWDPIAQKARWKVPLDTLWNGGVLSTGGDLVFQGAADGYVSAYHAGTGKRLWRFDAGHGVIAAPMSYAVDGRQYVAVLVGYGASAAIGSDVMNVGWKWGAPRRLLVFALDGRQQLPTTQPRDMTVRALDDPTLKIRPEDVAAGQQLFMRCATCHGRDLVGAGGPAPDLRESQIALDPEMFWTVVRDGALLQRGMPQFADLTPEQMVQLYAYIRAGAREAIGKQGGRTVAAR
ncbi:PQQ-dependent dehydrogenase, methanol/ethanol family [Phenylobacterium sp. LjRoot219]|uniref:PQQ-dependent dehydrogenase, methanol/ethanol family n=1 Tax=Phenylobacterium sp. LjRoot219 TaxID=3342283 RepID=UPI003ED08AFD